MSEVIFINRRGRQDEVSMARPKGEGRKPLSHKPVVNAKRKAEFDAWAALKTVYFPTWVWQEVCQRYPLRYKMNLPVYQGMKVILT